MEEVKESWKDSREGKDYDMYEFMSSVLTNYHTHPVVETPELIFGYNDDNTFGLVHF